MKTNQPSWHFDMYYMNFKEYLSLWENTLSQLKLPELHYVCSLLNYRYRDFDIKLFTNQELIEKYKILYKAYTWGQFEEIIIDFYDIVELQDYYDFYKLTREEVEAFPNIMQSLSGYDETNWYILIDGEELIVTTNWSNSDLPGYYYLETPDELMLECIEFFKLVNSNKIYFKQI